MSPYDDKQWWRDFFDSLMSQGEENLGKPIDYKAVPGAVASAATKPLIPPSSITDYLDLPPESQDTPTQAVLRSLGRDVAGFGSSLTAPASLATIPVGAGSDPLENLLAKAAKPSRFNPEITLPKLPEANQVLEQFTGRNEAGVVGDVAGANAQRARQLIQSAGGEVVRQSGDKIHWTDANGDKQIFDLAGRIGPRQVKLNPRSTGESLRQTNEAPRQLGEDVKSAAYDASGLSNEELSRPGVYYSVPKYGEPTYLGKKVDGPGAIIEVRPGELPRIYQGSGTAADLQKFRQSATGQDVLDKFYSERGAVGDLGPSPPRKGPKVVSAQAVPEVTLPGRFKLQTKYNNQPISFANNFDKAAYTLSTQKTPNQDLLQELVLQSNFDENTILQHGEKIANRVKSLGDAGQPIKLKPRSVSVIGEGQPESIGKTLLGVPSAVKFSIDLPSLRQSYMENVMHPFESGLPALKRGLSSFSEKGFRENAADMLENEPVHSILDTATALGPTKAQQFYPNINILRGLKVNDVPEYFTGTSRIKGTALGKYLTNPSERSYEMSQMSSRATGLNRLAKKAGLTVDQLVSDPAQADELAAMVRRINENTGYGPLGKLESAGNALSYMFTAPRNTSAKLMRYNPLNYVPESAMRKVPKVGDWLVNKGAASRYGSGTAYKDFITDQAKFAALMGGGAAAASAAGADVEPNPLATNFGIRFGNYKPDIAGGNLGLARLIPRLFTEDRVSARGIPYGRRINKITGQEEMSNESNDAIRYFRSQLRPGIPAMIADKYLPPGGVNFLGEDISKPFESLKDTPLDIPYSRWIVQQFTPSYPSDLIDIAQDNPKLLPIAIPLGIAGMGSSTYDPYAPNPYRKASQKKGKKASGGEWIR